MSKVEREKGGQSRPPTSLDSPHTHHPPLSSRRTWKPNTQAKALFSEALGGRVRVTVTTSALRSIDRAGGLDAYLLATPPAKLDSDVGEELRARVVAALEARRAAGQVGQPAGEA